MDQEFEQELYEQPDYETFEQNQLALDRDAETASEDEAKGQTNEQVKESIAVLDGSDPGFWGLGEGEHVVLLDGCMVHLDANNKVVAVEFMDDEGETHGLVEVNGGVPTFPQS